MNGVEGQRLEALGCSHRAEHPPPYSCTPVSDTHVEEEEFRLRNILLQCTEQICRWDSQCLNEYQPKLKEMVFLFQLQQVYRAQG